MISLTLVGNAIISNVQEKTIKQYNATISEIVLHSQLSITGFLVPLNSCFYETNTTGFLHSLFCILDGTTLAWCIKIFKSKMIENVTICHVNIDQTTSNQFKTWFLLIITNTTLIKHKLLFKFHIQDVNHAALYQNQLPLHNLVFLRDLLVQILLPAHWDIFKFYDDLLAIFLICGVLFFRHLHDIRHSCNTHSSPFNQRSTWYGSNR